MYLLCFDTSASALKEVTSAAHCSFRSVMQLLLITVQMTACPNLYKTFTRIFPISFNKIKNQDIYWEDYFLSIQSLMLSDMDVVLNK